MEKEKSDELTLPKSCVSKIIQESLPENTKCANETRQLITDCCVEFIHLVASEANEICNKENKKTIAPEHILKALNVCLYSSLSLAGFLIVTVCRSLDLISLLKA